MNAVAGFLGWLVIWTAVALAVAIPLGKFLARRRDYTIELEDWDPAPRNLTPHVPKSWEFSGSDLNDPREDRPRDSTPE